MGLSSRDSVAFRLLRSSASAHLCCSYFLWHRVVAELRRQRLAPQQPLQSHPRPPHHAKSLDRLIHIHGASRFEPATPRKQNRQIHLINTQSRQRRFHRQGWPRRQKWDGLPSVSFSLFASCVCIHHRTHTLFINRTKSPVNARNSARATVLFG